MEINKDSIVWEDSNELHLDLSHEEVSYTIPENILKRWYDLLGKSGENTKKQVRDEIGELLNRGGVDEQG